MDESIENQQGNNEKEYHLGGCTGKGFLPGKSGNPAGRPKRRTLTEDICEELGIEIKPGMDAQKVLAKVFVKRAVGGDFRFAKEIIDRLDGKVPDRLIGDLTEQVELVYKIRELDAPKDGDNAEAK